MGEVLHGNGHAERVGVNIILVKVAEFGGSHRVGAGEGMTQALDPGIAVLHRGAGGGGDAESDRFAARFLGQALERRRRRIERLVPADTLPAGIGIALRARALQGMEQALFVMDQLGRGPSLGAEHLPRGMGRVRLDGDEISVLDHRNAATA